MIEYIEKENIAWIIHKNIVDAEVFAHFTQAITDGWNQGSGQIFASVFAADADYTAAPGNYVKGRAAVEAAHQGIFDTIYRNTRLESAIVSSRYLTPDIALIRTNNKVYKPQADGTTVYRTHHRSDCCHQAGWTKWVITSFHNTPVR